MTTNSFSSIPNIPKFGFKVRRLESWKLWYFEYTGILVQALGLTQQIIRVSGPLSTPMNWDKYLYHHPF